MYEQANKDWMGMDYNCHKRLRYNQVIHFIS